LLARSQDFVKYDSVRDNYIAAVKSALMNAAMMNLKLKEYEACYNQLKMAKQFFEPKEDQSKLNYRMGACLNGMGRYKEAIDIFKTMVNSKDPLVKVEYNKALEAIKKDKIPTETEKDTYAKMFSPTKRKEEKQKREELKKKEEEEDKKDKPTNEEQSSILKYLIPAIAIGGIGYFIYKKFKS